MLKSLDILIGLIVILLALSMAVTLVTQVISTAVNRRGRDRRRGLVDLLQELDPVLTLEHSEKIATEILTHPLVSGSRTSWTGHRRVGRSLQLERLDPSLPNTVRQNAPILQEAGSDRTSQRFTVVLARKEDEQRTARQSVDTSAPAAVTNVQPVAGERGDLAATG